MRYILPNRYNLMFPAVWAAYMLLELVLGHSILEWPNLLIVLFFYFAGCLIQFAGRGKYASPQGRYLLYAGIGLVTADQLIKLAVQMTLLENQVVHILPRLVNLARVHNLSASWLAEKFQWQFLAMPLLMAISIFMLLAVIAIYRYYRGCKMQHSVWADAGTVLLAAGIASALLDQTLRGYTLDFINFPGLFTADIKDICLTLGIGAVMAEILRSPLPDVPFREMPSLIANIIYYNLGRR